MGAITVYLMRHARMLLAWSMILASAAIFYSAINNSAAYQNMSTYVDRGVSRLSDLASAVPLRVAKFNRVVHDILAETELAQWLFWMAGLDVASDIVEFVVANISAVMSATVAVGAAGLALAGLLWALRRTQRFIRVMSGGDLNVDVVD